MYFRLIHAVAVVGLEQIQKDNSWMSNEEVNLICNVKT